MSYSKDYIITTLSNSVQQYDTSFSDGQAPIIPTGRIRQPLGGSPYTAVNGTSKKFPLGFVCYNGDWVPGKVGNYALNFDGTNDYVSVGSVSDFAWMNGKENTSGFKFSVSFWIKFNSLPSGIDALATIISTCNAAGDQGIVIWYDDRPSGYKKAILFQITDGSGNPVAQLAKDNDYPDNTDWHHVVVTFDAGASDHCIIYVDGTLKSQITSQPTWAAPADSNSALPLTIGAVGNTAGGQMSYLPASLDELAIWNIVLTAAEITELYNRGVGLTTNSIQPSALVSYWNFEDGPGSSTIKNYPSAASASLNGTLTNMNAGTVCEFPVKKPW